MQAFSKRKSRAFTPGLASSLTTLLILPLFVYLGCWQLGRYHEKLALEEALLQRSEAPTLTVKDLEREKQALLFHRLTVKGKFLNHFEILLDNQISNHQAGYCVISPFLLEESHQIILVNRGWIPLGQNRSHLPLIKTPQGNLTLTGIIVPSPQGLVLKKDVFENPSWPFRIQAIDYPALSKILKIPVFPWLLRLSPENEHSFRVLPIHLGLPADKHLGYALQWFTIALVTTVYYGVISFRRKL